jgi:beta-glucosidase
MKSKCKKTGCLKFIIIVLISFLFGNVYGQIIPYKNPDLTIEERVTDLIKRMTVKEKVNQMLKLSLENLRQDENGRITQESLD